MVDLLIICQGTASSSRYGVEYGAAYGEQTWLCSAAAADRIVKNDTHWSHHYNQLQNWPHYRLNKPVSGGKPAGRRACQLHIIYLVGVTPDFPFLATALDENPL